MKGKKPNINAEVMRIIRDRVASQIPVSTNIEIKPEHQLEDDLGLDLSDKRHIAVDLGLFLERGSKQRVDFPSKEVEKWKSVKDVKSYIRNYAEQHQLYD